jgi:hypothetical protein
MSTLLEQMEELAPKIGNHIKGMLPKWAGFCLLIFDYGPTGDITYIATTQRDQMIRVMRKLADDMEKGLNKHPRAPS